MNQYKRIARLFILLFVFMATGCRIDETITSNELHANSLVEIKAFYSYHKFPYLIMGKDTQFQEWDRVNANELVALDASNATIRFVIDDEKVYSTRLRYGEIYQISVMDEYGNETVVEIEPNVIMDPRREGIPEDHLANEYFDLICAKTICISDEAYEQLKETYDSVDWYGEFEVGDLGVQELYKEKFKELVNNERSAWDPYEQKEVYIEELLNYTPNKFQFFDVDLNGVPELYICDTYPDYIFRYDSEHDQIILCYGPGVGVGWYIGSKKAHWINAGGDAYQILDENGDWECFVTFDADGYKD